MAGRVQENSANFLSPYIKTFRDGLVLAVQQQLFTSLTIGFGDDLCLLRTAHVLIKACRGQKRSMRDFVINSIGQGRARGLSGHAGLHQSDEAAPALLMRIGFCITQKPGMFHFCGKSANAFGKDIMKRACGQCWRCERQYHARQTPCFFSAHDLSIKAEKALVKRAVRKKFKDVVRRPYHRSSCVAANRPKSWPAYVWANRSGAVARPPACRQCARRQRRCAW